MINYPTKYDRLLCGGIWCIVQLDYEFIEEERNGIPISIRKLTPIQMPHVDINELKEGRKAFTKDEWIDVLLRSIGMEPDELEYREKWLLLTRMLPLIEEHPGELDLVEWVLFDKNTFEEYDKVLSQLQASKIVHSPRLDEINRMLRDGLF